ncbi:MAG: superoxide dismutase family protein, partial [Ferruginibacter sp.]
QSIKLSICLVIMVISMAACDSGDTSTSTTETSDSTMAMEMPASPVDTAMKEHAAAALTGVLPDTTVTGNVTFDAQPNGKVKMKLEISIPKKANSSVAVHIHEKGDCADMGKAAGGHWNPTNAQHGKWGGSSYHSGDIGNVSLDAKGNGTMEMETDLWTIGGGDKTNILDKSIIVHSGVDDFTSQPSGNAGTRIGCGIIK